MALAIKSLDSMALRRRVLRLERELEKERRANEALREEAASLRDSGEAYERLVELSTDAILVHDADRRIIFTNPPGVKLFGAKSADELIGRRGADFVHPDSRKTMSRRSHRTRSGLANLDWVELWRLRVDGTPFLSEGAAAPIQWRGRPGVLIVVRDITERRRVEQELRVADARSQEAEARLGDAMEAMSEAIALFDSEGRLERFNHRYAEEIWPNLSDVLVPGVHFETIVRAATKAGMWVGDDRDEEAIVQDALERHFNGPDDTEICLADGRWLRQSKRRTGDGGVIALYADITDIKKREAVLAEREERHRRLLETLPDGVIIHSGDRIAYVNPAAVRMLGATTHTDLVGRHARDFIHPDSAAEGDERRRQVLTEQCSLPPIEQKRLRLDGTTIEVEARATFIVWNGKPAILGVFRDLTEKKKAEALLRETERRLSAAAANMPGAIYQRVLHPDGTVTFPYLSQGVREIHGVDADAAMADPAKLLAALHPDDRKRYWRAIEESARTLEPFDVEVRNILPSGEILWLRSYARPRRRDDGSVIWDGLFVNINDQRKAEEQAAQAHAWLLHAIDSLPDEFVLWDGDDRLVLWNDKFGSSLSNREAFLVPGRSFMELLDAGFARMRERHGEKQARMWRDNRLRVFKEADGSHEVEMPDGRWVIVTERRTRDGFTVGIYTDISDRKLDAEKLHESEERYRKLVELSPDAIYVHRLGRISYINSAGVALFGASSPDELTGRHVLELTHPDFHESVAARQNQDVGAAATTQMEQLRLRLDGSEFVASVKAIPMTWEGARGALVIVRDVTDERRAKEALEEARDAAEFANRSKSEFLANMSHELRTPLNAVIGFSEVMKDQMLGPLGNPTYREYAKDIHDSGKHLLQLINDILDLSKVEAGKLAPNLSFMDPRYAIESSIRIVRGRAEEGGIGLTARINTDLPLIEADERMVKQILMNLLSNAVKFTPRHGRVRVAARCNGDDRIAISVIDNGIGIGPEDLEKIMAPFGQVESSMTRKFEGTGLGLPLTKSLVELHGGHIAIRSKPDLGTVVTVSLPIRSANGSGFADEASPYG